MNTLTEEINLAELAGGDHSSFKKNGDYKSRVKEQCPESTVRAEWFFNIGNRWFQRLDKWVEKVLSPAFNPFTQSGAIANLTFVIALVSGFVLLLWYKPSVYQAYDSLLHMNPAGEFFRALHRYSSDACMLFILFHAFKMFFAKRLGGGRWLAWVTGILAVALLWFDGWLGYWLVWDERANQVAVGTARMLDQLPIFAEPLSRSFLTDDSFNSLLFFLVFFFHMLIPLAIGIALWLHVSRLNKANFITNKPMTWAVTGSLCIMSVWLPADLTKPARMLEMQEAMPIDYFYMIPVYFTDRLEGGMLWLLLLVGFIGFISVPWLLVKKEPPKPEVDPSLCNGCEQCYKDCPFNAVTMLRREEGDIKRGDYYASIDPSKCMSCGICVGACDPAGISFPQLQPNEVRREVDGWLENRLDEEGSAYVAYICSASAGAELQIDEETGRCKELPGYIVRSVPCVGWVHPLMIERVLRKGAERVLVVGCQSEPDFRLGTKWTGMRLEGARHPELRSEKADPSRIRYLRFNQVDSAAFIREARAFREHGGQQELPKARGSKAARYIMGLSLIAVLGFLTYFFSKAPYSLPVQSDSSLVVSFTLPGRPVDNNVEDAPSQENLLPHMRRPDNRISRERSAVRLRIVVDGKEILNRRYEPQGLFGDRPSSALVEIPLKAGAYPVQLYLGDTAGEEWLYTDRRDVTFEEHHRRVVKFNREDGFAWYPGE